MGGTLNGRLAEARRRDPVFFTFLDGEGTILADELLLTQSWDLMGEGEIQWDAATLPADSFFDIFFEIDLDPDLLPDAFVGGPTIEDLGYAELLLIVPEPHSLGALALLAPLLAWIRRRKR